MNDSTEVRKNMFFWEKQVVCSPGTETLGGG